MAGGNQRVGKADAIPTLHPIPNAESRICLAPKSSGLLGSLLLSSAATSFEAFSVHCLKLASSFVLALRPLATRSLLVGNLLFWCELSICTRWHFSTVQQSSSAVTNPAGLEDIHMIMSQRAPLRSQPEVGLLRPVAHPCSHPDTDLCRG